MTETTTPSETTQSEQPQEPEFTSWEDLVAEYPVLTDGFPDLVKPENMTITQSIQFGFIRDAILAKQAKMQQLVTKVSVDDESTLIEVSSLIAQTIEMISDYFRTLASSVKKFDAWGRGRDPETLRATFYALMNFYGAQLGKSVRSKTSTGSTESN